MMEINWTTEIIALATVAFFAAGLVKGTIGVGFPLVVLACLSTALGLKEAMSILIIPGIVTNIWQAFTGKAFIPIIRRLWTLLGASVVGIWVGVQILLAVNPIILTGLLGVFLLIYSIFSLCRSQLSPPGRREWLYSPIMGMAGGLAFGMTGSYMVPGVLYIQALGMPRSEFVQSLGITFCFIMIILGLFLSSHDLLPVETVLLASSMLVPAGIGMFAGQKLRHHTSDKVFRTLFFIGLCFIGLYMVARAGF